MSVPPLATRGAGIFAGNGARAGRAVYMDIHQAIILQIHREFERIRLHFAHRTQRLILERTARTQPVANERPVARARAGSGVASRRPLAWEGRRAADRRYSGSD